MKLIPISAQLSLLDFIPIRRWRNFAVKVLLPESGYMFAGIFCVLSFRLKIERFNMIKQTKKDGINYGSLILFSIGFFVLSGCTSCESEGDKKSNCTDNGHLYRPDTVHADPDGCVAIKDLCSAFLGEDKKQCVDTYEKSLKEDG